jgi:hypothetical protein
MGHVSSRHLVGSCRCGVNIIAQTAIADTAIRLLDNDAARHSMRKRAYLYACHAVWDRVAQSCFPSLKSTRPIIRRPLKFSQGEIEPCWLRHPPLKKR